MWRRSERVSLTFQTRFERERSVISEQYCGCIDCKTLPAFFGIRESPSSALDLLSLAIWVEYL